MNNTNALSTKHSADILKFIMSVFVVATHTSLFAPHLTPVVRLAVPVFFVLSGYFFFSKVNFLDNIKDKTAYLKKSVKHNLQLYAFWFIVLSPITFYIRDYFSGSVIKGLLSLLHNFLLGSTFQASWYITALIFGLIFVFFMSQKYNNFTLIVIGILVYIPALLSSNYLFIAIADDRAKEIYTAFSDILLLPCRNVFVSVIYLVLGKILAEKGQSTKTKDGLISLTCFVLLIVEYLTLYFGKVQIKNTDCFIMLPFAAYYLCRWVLSFNIKCVCSSVLRKISTMSYCMHMAVYMIVVKIAFSLDINDFGNIIVFALTLLATWSLSLVILKLQKLKLFGFLKYSH
ncbi:MAG: acyltransferase family protein [Clostridia bacterium]|nr:acyltransferase family protein [Clostridia bacterium]